MKKKTKSNGGSGSSPDHNRRLTEEAKQVLADLRSKIKHLKGIRRQLGIGTPEEYRSDYSAVGLGADGGDLILLLRQVGWMEYEEYEAEGRISVLDILKEDPTDLADLIADLQMLAARLNLSWDWLVEWADGVYQGSCEHDGVEPSRL